MNKLEKIITLLCIFVLFTSFPCIGSEVTDDYYDIAQNYYKDGDKTKALEYINQILEIDKNNIPALGFKIKLTPPTTSKVFPCESDYIYIYTQYIPTGNKDSDTYYEAGLKYYKVKDYILAEENIKKSIESEPDNFMAYNVLGLIYWAQNKLDNAIDSFKKASEINNSYTEALDNISQIYKQKKDNINRYKTLEEAQNLNENDFYVYILLGDYYYDIKDSENALKNYRESIKISPDYYPAYYKIAKIRTEILDYSGANATLRYYLKLNPKDDYAYYLMAKNYIILEDYNGAQESIYKAINLCNCLEYRAELGKIYYNTDEIENALEAFNSSISNKTTAEIYNYIGMCYYNMHEFNKAIANITKSISMPDTRVLYYYNLAQVYYTLKDNVNYTRYMSLIKNYQPSSCQDYIDIGGILLDSDSKSAALSIINKGIEKYPDAKELYIEKQKIYDITDDTQGLENVKKEWEKKSSQ